MTTSRAVPGGLTRREWLKLGLGGAAVLAGLPLAAVARVPDALGEPDANGVRLPPGFRSRIVARTGTPPVAGGAYAWHRAPDGGATFAAPGGGWIYVSNSEVGSGRGGVGALRFDARGTLVDAYPILAGTSVNCAGGPTPWGTWLSCEEHPGGQVWECDPGGRRPAEVRPALGTFVHEAVAVDTKRDQLYLTEDVPDGGLYRFTPAGRLRDGRLDLADGRLEIAVLERDEPGRARRVRWAAVPDPSAASLPTRRQVPEAAAFRGGEGIWYARDRIWFTTKHDDRVWEYDPASARLAPFYDRATSATPILQGVDNVTSAPNGDLLVCEDGDDMQLVALAADGRAAPLLQVVGHDGSELAGPAFDPSGTRLYVSSQRGRDDERLGLTFEIEGPFARL